MCRRFAACLRFAEPKSSSYAAVCRKWLAPREVEAWRLPFRFAVVQHAYRPDMVDSYVDFPLWRALCEFAGIVANGDAITIAQLAPNQRQRPLRRDDEVLLTEYLSSGPSVFGEEWDAPERIVVRRDGAPVLVVASEYWVYAGGPPLYHDTMTYSIYSSEDIESRVLEFLRAAPDSTGWNLADVVIPAPDPPLQKSPSRTLFDRLNAWVRRDA